LHRDLLHVNQNYQKNRLIEKQAAVYQLFYVAVAVQLNQRSAKKTNDARCG